MTECRKTPRYYFVVTPTAHYIYLL